MQPYSPHTVKKQNKQQSEYISRELTTHTPVVLMLNTVITIKSPSSVVCLNNLNLFRKKAEQDKTNLEIAFKFQIIMLGLLDLLEGNLQSGTRKCCVQFNDLSTF